MRTIKAEFSPTSPKIRLTLAMHLLENSKPELSTREEWMGFLDELNNYVTGEYENYINLIEDIFDGEEEEGGETDTELGDDPDLGGGYTYL